MAGLFDRLQRRLGQTHANHRRVASGAMWVGLFVLAAKLCVAARDVTIAWRYGTSGIVDAYQLAVTVTTWLPMMLAGVAAAVLVPRLVVLRRDTENYWCFVRELNGTILLLGLVLGMLTWLLAPNVVALLAGPLDPAIVQRSTEMVQMMAPVAFFTLFAAYLSIRLQARERFGYSFLEAVPALGIALFVIAAPEGRAGSPLIWGTLLGLFLQMLWLAQLTRRVEGSIGGTGFRHRSEEWGSLYAPLLTMGAGQLFITLTIPIDQAFASRLGEGAIATLGYATRIVTLFTGLGSVVLARALLPVLSGAIADGNVELSRQQAIKWAMLMLAAGCATGLLGWLAAPIGVQILFERGAFGPAETEAVAYVLRYGLLQLPPFLGGIVLVQWFAAMGRYRDIVRITLVALIAKVAANALFLYVFGVAGIMIATAIMYTVTALLMAIGASRRLSAPA